jgi:hypothetical protein
MDWTQVFIAFIIPLLVSSAVLIIPYIMPGTLSKVILNIRKFQIPTVPSEIEFILINI